MSVDSTFAVSDLMIQGPLADAGMYPKDFVVDMNGKINPWEGIAIRLFAKEKMF